jgi:hypothetical protein
MVREIYAFMIGFIVCSCFYLVEIGYIVKKHQEEVKHINDIRVPILKDCIADKKEYLRFLKGFEDE